MGDVRSAIYSKLDPLFGGTNGVPIFVDAITEKAHFPAILYRFEKVSQDINLDGEPVFNKGTVIFHSFSYNKAECVGNANAIRDVFTGLRGPVLDIFIGWSLKLVDEVDAEIAAPDDSSKILYETRLSFYFGWV